MRDRNSVRMRPQGNGRFHTYMPIAAHHDEISGSAAAIDSLRCTKLHWLLKGAYCFTVSVWWPRTTWTRIDCEFPKLLFDDATITKRNRMSAFDRFAAYATCTWKVDYAPSAGTNHDCSDRKLCWCCCVNFVKSMDVEYIRNNKLSGDDMKKRFFNLSRTISPCLELQLSLSLYLCLAFTFKSHHFSSISKGIDNGVSVPKTVQSVSCSGNLLNPCCGRCQRAIGMSLTLNTDRVMHSTSSDNTILVNKCFPSFIESDHGQFDWKWKWKEILCDFKIFILRSLRKIRF